MIETVLDFLYLNRFRPLVIVFSSFFLSLSTYYYVNPDNLYGKERIKQSFLFGLKGAAVACVWTLPVALIRRVGFHINREEGEK